MLRWLLVICLCSAAHTRVILEPRELELGWPFGNTTNVVLSSEFLPYLRTFPDQCMLWNSSCSGNRTEALDEFFNNTGTMMQLVYGAWEYYAQHRKASGIPPDTNSMIVSWMRNPECRSSFLEWHTENLDQPSWTYSDREANQDVVRTLDWSSIATTSGNFGCCDTCELVGGNVDVYYWHEAEANTDCLASVGTTAASDIDQNLVMTDDRGVGGGWWKSQPNPYTFTSPPSLNSALPYSLNARGHAILSASENGSQAEVTAVQNGFTFTSPSIYVGFSSLYAVDRCGAIGTFVPYTMLAFAPGELSTIEYPAWDRGSIPPGATKSFNFADLPCPPSSVMVADQYKPSPGFPYRPVLSPPQQIYGLQLGWSDCVITHAFAGIDPPKSLVPAAALVPNLTPTSPQSQATETTSISSQKPAPGAVEAENTAATRDPPPAPAQKVQTTGPKSTVNPSSPSTTTVDTHTPETSSNPQDPQALETNSQLSKWQAPISTQPAPEFHTSSSNQDPPKDRSSLSPANPQVPKILLDPFHISRVSSDPSSDLRSTLSTSAVPQDLLPTHGEEHSTGADHGQNRELSTLTQESQNIRGTIATESGSVQPETLAAGGVSTEHPNLPNQNKGSLDGLSTHVADVSADPISAPNTAQISDVGSSISSSSHAGPQSSSYSLLPNDQGEHRPQTSPPSSNTNDGSTTTNNILASPSSLDGNPDPLISAASTEPNAIPQSTSEPLTSAALIGMNGVSTLVPDPLLPASASIGTNSSISISASSTHEKSTPTTISASREYSNATADSLLAPPTASSDLDPNASFASVPQSNPPNSSQPFTIGNETASPFGPTSISTTGNRAASSSPSSSTLENSRANTTFVPFKSGNRRSVTSCLTRLLGCFALVVVFLISLI